MVSFTRGGLLLFVATHAVCRSSAFSSNIRPGALSLRAATRSDTRRQGGLTGPAGIWQPRAAARGFPISVTAQINDSPQVRRARPLFVAKDLGLLGPTTPNPLQSRGSDGEGRGDGVRSTGERRRVAQRGVVEQIDAKTGEVLGRWPSGGAASRVLGLQRSSVAAVLRGQQRRAGGFMWRYGSIEQLDAATGEVIGRWRSGTAAARGSGVDIHRLDMNALLRGEKLTADGFKWRVAENAEDGDDDGEEEAAARRRSGGQRGEGVRDDGKQRRAVMPRQAGVVEQLDAQTGEVLGRWSSGGAASRALGLARSSVAKVLRGQQRRAGGFMWRYGSIEQLDAATGEVIGRWRSGNAAARDLGVDIHWLDMNALLRGENPTAGGFKWRVAAEDGDDDGEEATEAAPRGGVAEGAGAVPEAAPRATAALHKKAKSQKTQGSTSEKNPASATKPRPRKSKSKATGVEQIDAETGEVIKLIHSQKAAEDAEQAKGPRSSSAARKTSAGGGTRRQQPKGSGGAAGKKKPADGTTAEPVRDHSIRAERNVTAEQRRKAACFAIRDVADTVEKAAGTELGGGGGDDGVTLGESEGATTVATAAARQPSQHTQHDGRIKPRLLTAAEEVALSAQIQAERQVQDLRHVLARELMRNPTDRELAAAAVERGVLASSSVEELQAVITDGRIAKQQMIHANLGLVRSAAQPHVRRLSRSAKLHGGARQLAQDLTQEGVLGLVRAAEKFDGERGFRFSTYATPWVRAYVEKCSRQTASHIHIPDRVRSTSYRASAVERELKTELARMPTMEEVAEAAGVTPAKLLRARESAKVGHVLSYDASAEGMIADFVDDGDGGAWLGTGRSFASNAVSAGGLQVTLAHAPTPLGGATADSLQQEISGALVAALSSQEQRIIRLRYGLDDGTMRTYREVAEILGLTGSGVRNALSKCFRKLKNNECGAALLQYVEEYR